MATFVWSYCDSIDIDTATTRKPCLKYMHYTEKEQFSMQFLLKLKYVAKKRFRVFIFTKRECENENPK